MPKLKPNYEAEKKENILILIKDIKARQHLLDKDVAKIMNIPLNTFRARKQNPEDFRFKEIWPLMQIVGVADERKIEIL